MTFGYFTLEGLVAAILAVLGLIVWAVHVRSTATGASKMAEETKKDVAAQQRDFMDLKSDVKVLTQKLDSLVDTVAEDKTELLAALATLTESVNELRQALWTKPAARKDRRKR